MYPRKLITIPMSEPFDSLDHNDIPNWRISFHYVWLVNHVTSAEYHLIIKSLIYLKRIKTK